MSKKFGYAILILFLAGVAIYCYSYQDHRDIRSENASYTVTITELAKEFSENDSLAFAKYQDQTIEITGKITVVDFDNKAIMLDDKVFANFIDSLPKNLLWGQKTRIKGRFLGYDELLNEFKIDQSSIID